MWQLSEQRQKVLKDALAEGKYSYETDMEAFIIEVNHV